MITWIAFLPNLHTNYLLHRETAFYIPHGFEKAGDTDETRIVWCFVRYMLPTNLLGAFYENERPAWVPGNNGPFTNLLIEPPVECLECYCITCFCTVMNWWVGHVVLICFPFVSFIQSLWCCVLLLEDKGLCMAYWYTSRRIHRSITTTPQYIHN